jgi:hypothetical protein
MRFFALRFVVFFLAFAAFFFFAIVFLFFLHVLNSTRSVRKRKETFS